MDKYFIVNNSDKDKVEEKTLLEIIDYIKKNGYCEVFVAEIEGGITEIYFE